MDTAYLPSDLRRWPEVKSQLVDLYDGLVDHTIDLEEAFESLEAVHAIIDSGSHDNASFDAKGSKKLSDNDAEESEAVRVTNPSSRVWHDMLQFFHGMDQEGQKHFLYFTLPGVVQMALSLDEAVRDYKVGWSSQQPDTQVVFSRYFLSSVVACLFLQLWRGDNPFTALFKQLSFSLMGGLEAMESFLGYFDQVIECCLEVRGQMILHRKTLHLPLGLDDLASCDLNLCPLTLQCGDRLETCVKDDTTLQIDFCGQSLASHELEQSWYKEDQLVRLHPELLAVTVKAKGLSLNEVLIVSGFDTFSPICLLNECVDEQVTKDPNRSTDLVVLGDLGLGRKEDFHQREWLEDSIVRQALNLTLLGFSGCHTLSNPSFLSAKHSQQRELFGMCDNCLPPTDLGFISLGEEGISHARQHQPEQLQQQQLNQQQQQQQQYYQQDQMPEPIPSQQQQQLPFWSSCLISQPTSSSSSSPSSLLPHTSTSSLLPLSYTAVSSSHQRHHQQQHDHVSSISHDNLPGASTTTDPQHIPFQVFPTAVSTCLQPPPLTSTPTSNFNTLSTQLTTPETGDALHKTDKASTDLTKNKDISQKNESNNVASALSAFLSTSSQTSPLYNKSNSEYLHDILGNLPKCESGALPMAGAVCYSAISNSLPSKLDNDHDNAIFHKNSDDGCIHDFPVSHSRYSPQICDSRSELVQTTSSSTLPQLISPYTDHSGPRPADQSCDKAEFLDDASDFALYGNNSQKVEDNIGMMKPISISSPITSSIILEPYTSLPTSSLWTSRSPSFSSIPSSISTNTAAIFKSSTLPPLQVEIPPIGFIPSSSSPRQLGNKNLTSCATATTSASRRLHRRRQHSREEQQTTSVYLEPPLSSSPQSSSSSLNTSPNSSFTLPDPAFLRNLNANINDVEVTADFFIPGIDQPENPNNANTAIVDQEYSYACLAPGTNGSRDFHSQLQELISSSSSTSGSGILLGQCVPSSSGCSHWGSRSGSLSSHGTNGSSNDFIEFWYNLRRRSSQMSDASRTSSSSKHSSDFSTDLEDISENLSKRGHEVIEEEGGPLTLSDFASQFVNSVVHMAMVKETDNVGRDNGHNRGDDNSGGDGQKVMQNQIGDDSGSVEDLAEKERGPVCVVDDSVKRVGDSTRSDENETRESFRTGRKDFVQVGDEHRLETNSKFRDCEDGKCQQQDLVSVTRGYHENQYQKEAEKQHVSSIESVKDVTGSLNISVSPSFSSPTDSAFHSAVSPSASASTTFNLVSCHTTPPSIITDAVDSGHVKDSSPPPVHTSFSPPQQEHTMELRGDQSNSPSFAVLESKVVYLEDDDKNKIKQLQQQQQHHHLQSVVPTSDKAISDCSHRATSTTTEHIKSSTKSSSAPTSYCKNKTVQPKIISVSPPKSSHIQSRPTHIPRSSPNKSLTPSPKSQATKTTSIKNSSINYRTSPSTPTTKSALKSNTAPPHPITFCQQRLSTNTDTSLHHNSALNMTSIPKLKSSQKPSFQSACKTSQQLPKSAVPTSTHSPKSKTSPLSNSTASYSTNRRVNRPSLHKQGKSKTKSPLHSPRSRYIFSDLAAPLDSKVKTKIKQPTKTIATSPVKKGKESTVKSQIKKSPGQKNSNTDVATKINTLMDVRKLPGFWCFVNSMVEQAVSQAVLEGAEIMSTQPLSHDAEGIVDDYVEELSDEVYNWFADKIVHTVFFTVLESLETHDDGDDDGGDNIDNRVDNAEKEDDNNAMYENDYMLTGSLSGFSNDNVTSYHSCFASSLPSSSSIAIKNSNGKTSSSSSFLPPSSFLPTGASRNSTSSTAAFKPTPSTTSSLLHQKSTGASTTTSTGRSRSLMKTVSFEDSNREPVRTGSEGDLSRQPSSSSFHNSSSSNSYLSGSCPVFHHHHPHQFHHHNCHQEKLSTSAWSISSQDQQQGSSTAFDLSYGNHSTSLTSSSLRLHRRLTKSATDLPRWGSLTNIEWGGGGGRSSGTHHHHHPHQHHHHHHYHHNLRAVDVMRGRKNSDHPMSRNLLGRKGSLTNTDSSSRGSIVTGAMDNSVRFISAETGGSGRRDSLTGADEDDADAAADDQLFETAVSIVNQVFNSISDSLDVDNPNKGVDTAEHDALYPGASYRSGQYHNIFSSSCQTNSSSSLRRSHRSVSPNVGVFSRKPMSRESLTNAFLKVDSQPSVQNYERRSSEPCHTSVQLSLEVFNKNRYSYKPAEEPQQTACTDDDIGRTGSRISWRRGSLDNFSFESPGNHNNMSGFKDPILSRFAEELMKADTSVPELVIVGSNPSSCTTGSRRSSFSGFRDTTLANLESELLNTSFTSVNSLPLSQSPRSQGGRSQQAKARSRNWEDIQFEGQGQQARSDSSDTEHWFPTPRHVGEDFHLEFSRQQSQGGGGGQEEVQDLASFFAGCVVQEAVCVIKSDPDYQTGSEMAISLYAENLTDQILRDAFITTRDDVGKIESHLDDHYNCRDGYGATGNTDKVSLTSKSTIESDVIKSKDEIKIERKTKSSYFGEGAKPKVKTSSLRSTNPSAHTSLGKETAVTPVAVAANKTSVTGKPGHRNVKGTGNRVKILRSSPLSSTSTSTAVDQQQKHHQHHGRHHHQSSLRPSASVRSAGREAVHDGKPSSHGKVVGVKPSASAPINIRPGGSKGRQFVADVVPITKAGQLSPCGSGGRKQKIGKISSGTGEIRMVKTSRTAAFGSGRCRGGLKPEMTSGSSAIVVGGGNGHFSQDFYAKPNAVKTRTEKYVMTLANQVDNKQGSNSHLGTKEEYQTRYRRRRNDSSANSSSYSSSLDRTGSSFLSDMASSPSPSPRNTVEDRKKRRLNRQDAVSISKYKTESKTGSKRDDEAVIYGSGSDGSGRLHRRSRDDSGGGGGGDRSGARKGRQTSEKVKSSSWNMATADSFAAGLSERIVMEGLKEAELLPWWRKFPTCYRPITSHGINSCGDDRDTTQLDFMVKWIVASLLQCPHLVIAGLDRQQPRMAETERVISFLSGRSVGFLATAIRDYSRYTNVTTSTISTNPITTSTASATGRKIVVPMTTTTTTTIPMSGGVVNRNTSQLESHKYMSSSSSSSPKLSLFQYLLDISQKPDQS